MVFPIKLCFPYIPDVDALPKQPLSGCVREWIGSGSHGVSRRSPCGGSPPDFLGCCLRESMAQRVYPGYRMSP